MDFSTAITVPPPESIGYVPAGATVELGESWVLVAGDGTRIPGSGALVVLQNPVRAVTAASHPATYDGYLVLRFGAGTVLSVTVGGSSLSARIEDGAPSALIYYKPAGLVIGCTEDKGWSTTTKVVLGTVGGVVLATFVGWIVRRHLDKWAERQERLKRAGV